MRARLARPRRIVRGRLVAPVAAAAAVALVGGVVVAAPDAPTVNGDVQTVAGSSSSASPLTVTGFTAGGAEFSFDIQDLASGVYAGIEITEVVGLPEGLTYADGAISGTPAVGGTHHLTVIGNVNGAPVSIPATLVVNNTDGTAPTGASGGSTAAVEGSLGGQAEAGGQVTTGSDGTDAILGAVAGIVSALGGDAGSVTELATGSTGQGGTTPVNPDGPENPTGPLGSLAGGELGLGSLSNGAPEAPETDAPDVEAPAPGSVGLPGSSATAEGEATGGIDTSSLGPLAPLGSLIDAGTETGSTTDGGTQPAGSTTTGGTTTGGELTTAAELTGGGEITVPGSSFPADTGSLGALAPGLALTGAAMLGLAGLTLALNGGSSTPGSTAILPALPGSTTTGATTNGGSSGSTAPTVAAGAPRTVQAPGPTVANGRG
ncbi:hypothetical protein [Dietzia cinnamea]|uniref:hypothetical protein n=1 Tax=Dietzia cinnamea TaxID=321318 RepID=UPI0021A31BC1|nr:hypothetical protein [Dietzia cinnamea]MCT2275437.1 hypothetical protein [Dietzia cinnamea]